MTDEEKQEDDNESTDSKQGISVECKVLTGDMRHSECGRKPFKHFGQNIYEQ